MKSVEYDRCEGVKGAVIEVRRLPEYACAFALFVVVLHPINI